MYNKALQTFLRKLLVLSLPMVVLFLCYAAIDPFKTIGHYERYFDDHVAHVSLNMDFVSTENFVNRNPVQHYNAFIFGNSRSQYWQTGYWQKFIGDSSRCYHYYGNGESLYSMTNNIQFIHNSGNRIDHALFVVDVSLLRMTEPMTGHLSSTPPRVVGYRNILKFHATNFVAFLNPLFAYTYIDLRLTKTLKPYMLERFLIEQPVVYHSNSNEVVDEMFDRAIANGTYYTEKRMLRFHDKQYPDSVSEPVLFQKNIRMLTEIAHILRHHHTQYKVIINPLFDQIRFNPTDLQVLQDIFGKQNVYDFSGKNAINSDYRNYYEDSHYRPIIARQLMDSIYSRQ